jgi:hypothetical protein
MLINDTLYYHLGKLHTEQIRPTISKFEDFPYSKFEERYVGHAYDLGNETLFIFHAQDSIKHPCILFIVFSPSSKISKDELKYYIGQHLESHHNISFLYLVSSDTDWKVKDSLRDLGFKFGKKINKYFIRPTEKVNRYLQFLSNEKNPVRTSERLGWLIKSLSQLTEEDVKSILKISDTNFVPLLPRELSHEFILKRTHNQVFIDGASRYFFNLEGICLGYAEGMIDSRNSLLVRFDTAIAYDTDNFASTFAQVALTGPLLKLYKRELVEVQVITENTPTEFEFILNSIADDFFEIDTLILSKNLAS